MRYSRWRGLAGGLALGACGLALALPPLEARAQTPAARASGPEATETPWYRIFLLDGQILSAIGEFTRVDDQVMLQVPLGAPGPSGVPEPRTVTIPAAAVDWPRTEAYRDALRRAQFVRSGGEQAYAAFTEEVAATLRDVALIPDPLERIRRLESLSCRYPRSTPFSMSTLRSVGWPSSSRLSEPRRLEIVPSSITVHSGLATFCPMRSLNAETFYSGMGLKRLDVISLVMTPDIAIPVVLMEGPVMPGR